MSEHAAENEWTKDLGIRTRKQVIRQIFEAFDAYQPRRASAILPSILAPGKTLLVQCIAGPLLSPVDGTPLTTHISLIHLDSDVVQTEPDRRMTRLSVRAWDVTDPGLQYQESYDATYPEILESVSPWTTNQDKICLSLLDFASYDETAALELERHIHETSSTPDDE